MPGPFNPLQSAKAVGLGRTAVFYATGGDPPYTFEVAPDGVGGTIDSDTGIYTAPEVITNPAIPTDLIVCRDSFGNATVLSILVGNALILFCDILQTELGLQDGRVFLWDQKIFQPTDAGLYIAVSVPSCRPFANNIRFDGSDGFQAVQSVNMLALIDIDIMSRGTEALNRKEEIILALNSVYAQSQQELNTFYIGKLPPGARFTNLSLVDGAAIPYRYRISVNMQYFITKTKFAPFFDTFAIPELTTDP